MKLTSIFRCRISGVSVLVMFACLSLMSSFVTGTPLMKPGIESPSLHSHDPAWQSRGDRVSSDTDITSRFYNLEKRITLCFDKNEFTDERDARSEYVNLLVRVFGDRDWHTVTQRLYHISVEQVCQLTPDQQALIVKARKSYSDGERLKGSRKYLSALASFEEASSIYRKLLGAKDVWAIASRVQTAQMQQMNGKFDDAKATLEEIVPLVKSIYGENDPCYADVLQNLGVVNFRLGTYDQAESQLRSSLEVQQIANGAESYQASIAHYQLACLYNEQRQFPKAESEAKIGSKIVARMLPDKCKENILVLWQLGKSCFGQEKYSETAAALARVVQLIETFNLSPPDPLYAEMLDTYATALQKISRDKEATEYTSRADALRAKQQRAVPESTLSKKNNQTKIP